MVTASEMTAGTRISWKTETPLAEFDSPMEASSQKPCDQDPLDNSRD
jgi:hypothetical protein